jgi:hypothetical protein
MEAFSDTNLNHYIEGSRGGKDTKYGELPDPKTVRQRLTYTKGVKVGNGGDGYVVVSERGGNNNFYLLARDMEGKALGSIFIRRASNAHCSTDNRPAYGNRSAKIDNNHDYFPSGRMQENFQEICVAVYPIQELAKAGTTIGSIEMWAASRDAGDGKVMLITYLDAPDVCYDYTVRQNSHTLPSEDRNFTAANHGDIGISLGLKSMIADYDMTKSKLRLDASPLQFKKAEFSPDGINIYKPATYIHGTNIPEIALGNDLTEEGGVINSQERYFSKFTFYSPPEGENIAFNFDLNITVDTSDAQNNPITYMLTSDPRKYNAKDTVFKELKRCPISERYLPTWGQFNIERTNSGSFDPKEEKNLRFPLYTQVAGKDFDFSVVSYDANSTPEAFAVEKPISNVVVEVELIDVTSYNDAETYFKCNDPAHEILRNIGDNGSIFVQFKNNVSRVNIDEGNDLQISSALRSAAFRIWTLHDTNGTFISNNCIKEDGTKNDSCFEKLYEDRLEVYDEEGYCRSCSSYDGGCYQCLKDHFAKPTCSRDNFSIRPASYSMQLSDTNESDDSSDPSTFIGTNHDIPSINVLSAGYLYKIDANATQYGSNAKALGYEQDFMGVSSLDLVSSLNYKDSGASCADTDNKPLGMRFFDGKIVSNLDESTNGRFNNLQTNTNVGNYDYHIEDLNWTRVDQKRARTRDGRPLKTFPGVNDCAGFDSGDTLDSLYGIPSEKDVKVGCGISSILSAGGKTYADIPLKFEPYTFDLSQVNSIQRPNKSILFMNDFSESYYGTVLSTQISMATSFEGNVTARGKQNTRLTNFTKGCAASDVILNLNRTMMPSETTIPTIPLQQYLEVGLDIVDSAIGINKTLTLPSSAFDDSDKGHAPMQLHTTLQKPYGFGNAVNPVKVNYEFLHASDPTASSSTHMINNYLPEGNNTYDQNTTYVYGKVTPHKRLYENIESSSWRTPLYVSIFCDDSLASLTPGDCINTFNLNENSKGLQEIESGWKHATLFSNNELGLTDITASHLSESNADPFVSVDDAAKAKTVTDVAFDDNVATQNDINVSVAGTARNSMVKVNYAPVPWLVYDVDNDYFRVHFIGPTSWAGVGKTGHVTDTESSKTQNNRMVW